MPRWRATAAGDVGGVGDDEHQPADGNEPQYPARHERGTVAARPGMISIRMTAMMDSTLMSTAIASGRIPPIA